jgi:hypothetical protein
VKDVRLPMLHAGQKAAFNSPARFRVVVCGRRWGKSSLAALIAGSDPDFGALLSRRPVWWVAPTFRVGQIGWRMLRRLYRPLTVEVNKSEGWLRLRGGGQIWVRSAHNPDHLRGEGIGLVIVDEAAFVPGEVWREALRPALADTRGKALLVSTPHGRNWFWEVYLRGQDPTQVEWRSWQFPTSANPHIAPEEIEAARAHLPERIFQQEYLAEFLEDAGGVFRRVREAAIAPSDARPIEGHRYVMGVDWGRALDFSCFVVIDADERAMVAMDRFNRVEWALQRGRLTALARRWQVEMILAELNAMGEPNVEALRREGLPVRGFMMTATSKPPLIDNLTQAIESGELAILPDPVLIGELEAYQYQAMPSGQARYGAPEGMHDDTVIALALAWRAAQSRRVMIGFA